MQPKNIKNFNQAEVADILVGQLQSIESAELGDNDRLKHLINLYHLIFEESTHHLNIQFTTLFSRIAFTSNHYQFDKRLIFLNHNFRKHIETGSYRLEIGQLISLAIYVISENLNAIFNVGLKPMQIQVEDYAFDEKKFEDFQQVLPVILTNVNREEKSLVFVTEEKPHLNCIAHFENSYHKKDLEKILEGISKYCQLPISANLIDVTKQAENHFQIQALVLEPDFMINITAVAEGFKPDGKTVLNYITRKLIPIESSIHILKGNIVNFILDELIHDVSIKFEDLLDDIFKLFPEAFAVMNDGTLRNLLDELKQHFKNLKHSIQKELTELKINKESSYLEPSFYSAKYGFQGRLDLFHKDESSKKINIVELKSGKVYKPNGYNISVNHYIQTLLYGLLIESVYGVKEKPNCYILYSSQSEKSVRYAPSFRKKQLEAINHRSKLFLLEKRFLEGDLEEIFNYLDPDNIPSNLGFIKRDAQSFWNAYKSLDDIERSYFIGFTQFLTREFHLSKIGVHGIDKVNGLASLWLDPIEEKEDNFNIISNLKLDRNESDQAIPLLYFNLSDKSNPLSKFRKGDIAVLYPFDGSYTSVLKNQIFKCNIIDVHEKGVTVRLRFRQKNPEFFFKYDYWNLEYDVLDSSFNASYYGLYYFINATKERRDLLLSRSSPRRPEASYHYSNKDLTSEQEQIMSQMINAKDYYLLWGPPGTGKTSFMLKHFVKYLFEETTQNILLLSYTNRSVDEMCAAVSDISKDFDGFLRMGSRFSTDDKFQKFLLRTQMSSITKRSTLVDLIKSNRIVISTVSTIQRKHELFKLKQFDTIIIDEASQILEPILVGLLARAKKFILIGDHKQLPAVVVQDEENSKVENTELHRQIGLKDYRTSLFERLYKNCKQKEWSWAYGVLTQQGRMHKEIMAFSSRAFYEDRLRALEGLGRLDENLKKKTPIVGFEFIRESRLIFINTPVDKNIIYKTNEDEAKLVAILVKKYKEWHSINNIDFHDKTIGVIAPFRAQIAKIFEELRKAETNMDDISVDTVERYQGSARDIIIISLTSNNKYLLESMANISEEGIDRKLNVALTRAKEQIIILGNEKVLAQKPIYASLIEASLKINYESLISLSSAT